MTRLLLPAAALVALLAAGCGGSRITGPLVKTNHVTMVKSYRFDPDRVEIRAGDTVTWTNEDNFTHTVRVDGQDDHKVERGHSVSITFDKPGTYTYECTLHSMDMKGEVVVQ